MKVVALEEILPFTPQQFAILSALAFQPQHVYGLMQQVAKDTNGLIAPGSGSAYPALKRFEAYDFVEPNPGPKRRDYELTERGRYFLKVEAERLISAGERAERRLAERPATIFDIQ